MTPPELANTEHLYEFHPPVWITDTTLRKSPFVPQMGDEVRTQTFKSVHMKVKLLLLRDFLVKNKTKQNHFFL